MPKPRVTTQDSGYKFCSSRVQLRILIFWALFGPCLWQSPNRGVLIGVEVTEVYGFSLVLVLCLLVPVQLVHSPSGCVWGTLILIFPILRRANKLALWLNGYGIGLGTLGSNHSCVFETFYFFEYLLHKMSLGVPFQGLDAAVFARSKYR